MTTVLIGDIHICSRAVTYHMSQSLLIACPLCGSDCESEESLRVHLHTNHAKNAVIEAYLEALDS
jgi:hypothetical protein